jgi:hypothetical protein
MMNYLKKFALEILPSVAATVIGAYIVNHYISKPADPPVAAVVAPATDAKKSKPAESADANSPQPGVKAKGISERGMMEKAASEQPGDFKPAEAKSAETKSAETKPAEAKPAETASAPAEPRRHFFSAPKAVAKATNTAAPATTPAPAASPAAPAETVATTAAPADGRDANDLARAAIERLRGSEPRTQEAARTTDAPRVEAPRSVTPPPATASLKPLPPPITVAPPVESAAVSPPYTATVDPNRPTPPADIPPPPPMDIRADASKLATRTTNMAQDVLRSAKSMFHAVIPGSSSDRQQNSSSASQFTD